MRKTEEIRKALKEMGYNSRMVSVANRPGGYDWSINLTIRDAAVKYYDVEKIKNQYTSVDYCQASGEILSGGNTFINIRIAEEVEKAWAGPYVEKVKEAVAQVKGNYGVKVTEDIVLYLGNNNEHTIQIYNHKSSWGRYDYSRTDIEGIALGIYHEIRKAS